MIIIMMICVFITAHQTSLSYTHKQVRFTFSAHFSILPSRSSQNSAYLSTGLQYLVGSPTTVKNAA